VIRSALGEAGELVVLWIPWALDCFFIVMEVGAAWVRNIPIVQLLYGLTAGDLSERPGFPELLRQRQMIRLDDLDRHLDYLERRIREGAAE
jgi:hypothetical protein